MMISRSEGSARRVHGAGCGSDLGRGQSRVRGGTVRKTCVSCTREVGLRLGRTLSLLSLPLARVRVVAPSVSVRHCVHVRACECVRLPLTWRKAPLVVLAARNVKEHGRALGGRRGAAAAVVGCGGSGDNLAGLRVAWVRSRRGASRGCACGTKSARGSVLTDMVDQRPVHLGRSGW